MKIIGLGTVINVIAIITGGILGILLKRFVSESLQDSLIKVLGTATIFLGIAGALEGLLVIEDGKIVSVNALLLILSLTLGTLVGELLELEDIIERFGGWLKKKFDKNGSSRFVEGFVTASLTVCVGAMAIVGAIRDGMYGDYSILFAKSILDFTIILVMAASFGKGVILSFIPVAIVQGFFTLIATVLSGVLSQEMINGISFVGSAVITCVGINLIWSKTFKVGNMLPSLLVVVLLIILGL